MKPTADLGNLIEAVTLADVINDAVPAIARP
jgi:hypothetical protein